MSPRHSADGNSDSTSSRAVRMRDVADRAGVGMMTVSRVLNGTARVREETRARVYRALEELQYRPNHLARALRGSRSYSIGVIVPDLNDSFFASYAHAINAVAKRHSYSVLLTTSDENTETELEEARQLLGRQVDGLIVIPACNGRSHLNSHELTRTPIVVADRPVPQSRLDCILVDNKKGSIAAVEHLIQHGHRRICYIGMSQRIYTIQARLAGYKKAMESAHLQPEVFLEGEKEDETLAYLKGLRARPDPPTAIFASNGFVSRHALHALATLGTRIPDEMAIIGFDDFELADILQPALTVIRQPVQRLGQEAAELLFARLTKSAETAPKKVLLPVELVLRRSCGCHDGQSLAQGS
jgi:LacI family transcriptional regulator